MCLVRKKVIFFEKEIKHITECSEKWSEYYTCKECEDEVYIGEAIKTTYDIIQWAKTNNKVGIISLIDFEKAYDSLSFSYIKKMPSLLKFR